MNMHRRNLLRSLGLLGSAYFLPSTRPSRAQTSIPKRLIIYWTYHGTLPQFFIPRRRGSSETDFDLGEIHAPLEDYRNKLVVMSGLDMPSHRVTLPNLDNCGHWYGTVQSLTGRGQQNDRFQATGPSIDQHVVEGFRAANGGVLPTRLGSLQLKIGVVNFNFQTPFFSGPGVGMPPDVFASRVVTDRLFPDGPPTNDEDGASLRRRQRQAVLGEVRARYSSMKSSLGRLENERLGQHEALLNDLYESVGVVGRSCSSPATPTDSQDYDTRTNEMLSIMQTAVACDVTRVIGIVDDGRPERQIGFTPGAFGQPDLHQLIHSVDRGGGLASNPDAVKIVKDWHIEYSKNFAKILRALDEIVEPDGSTALDNSLVLWAGEIAEGNHGLANLHWVLAGGAQGAIQTGRYVAFGDPLRRASTGDRSVPTVNDLFCSIASAVGVPTSSFGLAEACTGPIPRIFA